YKDKKEFYRRNPASNRYRHLSDEVLYLSDPEVLREEIRQDRFVVYLQPKLSSSKRSAVGAEALIRYQSRSGSLMLPGNFLPMLEESRTISQIDFYVFEYACSRLRAWSEQGRQTLPIAVNFSRCSLSQPDFIARLTALCRKYNVEKKYLEIELTETAHEAGGVDLKALIRDLRQVGFVVSIDDFGTEYANLSLLSTIEFDVLKLDKSLVDDVAISGKARIVVENIVNICREMGIQVVAEGIETEEQLEALRSCGVELVQGYLFSKPIPIEEYERTYL
ncbi:MAG: EAL domain-containing protein, partial [Clostridium sp.]|nr:EAL domain-containing protein [Clostridium sp.]